eukprot:TRINITY_DN81026_c0_g1_i1.p1 TRINITY_DN81026_c0_g1~~TRINITY_DN81026_c0_g1_i1.p1  ORF type:complete len:373 (-),score=87.38 TRINITY_DN81026_c0_g1_i1:197-1315(-)
MMRFFPLFVVCIATLSCSCIAFNVSVIVRYPADKSDILSLRGGLAPLSWDKGLPFSRDDDSTFFLSFSVDDSEEGYDVQVKVMLNDEYWQTGVNDVITLSSEGNPITLFPFFGDQDGDFKVLRNVYSPELKNERDVIIYLPPSFQENPYKMYQNVLIMHDGQNLFDPSTSFMGQCWWVQNTTNKLIKEGSMKEVLIIGPYNTPDRENEYTYSYDPSEKQGGKGDLYLDFLEKTLVPLVSSKLDNRLVIEEGSLSIGGSSLGGLISCYAGWTRKEVYGKSICMSPSFWWNSEDFDSTILPSKTPEKRVGKFYLDTGTLEKDIMDSTDHVRDHFEKIQYTTDNGDMFYFLDVGGDHNEYYWGRRFWHPMEDLFQ